MTRYVLVGSVGERLVIINQMTYQRLYGAAEQEEISDKCLLSRAERFAQSRRSHRWRGDEQEDLLLNHVVPESDVTVAFGQNSRDQWG
jgi:hypothetical protein